VPILSSIIILVYNLEDYILVVIESVKSQTFKNFEVNIVDDNSSDSTAELVEAFIENDARF
jgi:glycosyltransferase involved in cell wall biosynthesis